MTQGDFWGTFTGKKFVLRWEIWWKLWISQRRISNCWARVQAFFFNRHLHATSSAFLYDKDGQLFGLVWINMILKVFNNFIKNMHFWVTVSFNIFNVFLTPSEQFMPLKNWFLVTYVIHFRKHYKCDVYSFPIVGHIQY
jgi:hypothetical protein